MQKTTIYTRTILQYIEKNLMSEIDPDIIAKRHFISLRQLYRDFYSYTGHSIKEYIRKRRISNSCEKIKCSNISLAAIANESGCQTQQAFHKQFKSIVGMTPLEYRQSDTYFYFNPFSIDEISIAVKVGYEQIPDYTTTRFYDSCLIGIENRAILALREINGRIFGRNGAQVRNQFCYEIMTEKKTATDEHCHNLCEGKVGTYATCVVNYNEQDINNGWNYLYNTWLSASMFEQSGDEYFEEYLFRNGNPYKLKLYLPVKKRKTAQHITISQIPELAFIIAKEKGVDAERKASKKVIEFLQDCYPLLIPSARRFYVCAYNDVWECGIECRCELKLPSGSNLEIVHIPAGLYAILPDDCFGDVRVGTLKMDAWLTNNNITHQNQPIFAIYETRNGKYDTDSTKMTIYKLLKDDKNG